MKKIIIASFFVLTLYASTPSISYAIFCSNCSNFIQQYAQLAKAIISSNSDTITATQQTLETINNRILIPIRDAMTIVTIMKSGDNINNLILGSLGTQPLLISNPEQYFKDRALASIGIDLSVLSRNTGIYNSSILASLINTNRYNYADASTKLKVINQSSIPKIVQKQVCEDVSLSQLAQEDVLASSDDGTIDEVALADRKRELYRALCSGDPDTNPALATTLMKLGEQRPDLGGWDAWLARTSGDNTYNKTVQSQLVIATKAQEAIDRAKLDYTIGGGLKSLTECKTYAENDLNGNLYGEASTPGCAVEEIKQVSSVLNSIYTEAMNAPTKLLQSTLGPGAGNLVNTAFTSINLIQGMSNAMDFLAASDGGSRAVVGNTPITVSPSTTTPTKDLTNNPKAKETLSTPPKEQLVMHQQSLTTMERVSQDYISTINVFQANLESMKACYNQLALNYPQTESDSRMVAALDYYQSKTNSNSTLKAQLSQAFERIGTTRILISTTLEKINTSQSSEEILNLFRSYQDQVTNQGLPDIMAGSIIEGEYTNYKGDVEQSSMEGGTLNSHNMNCSAIQMEILNSSGAGA